MNPFREKSLCTALFMLFLFIAGLLPAVADDYTGPAGQIPQQDIENDELNQPPDHKPQVPDQMGQKGQELGKKGKELGQQGKKGQELGKKDQELNQKGKKGQELGKKGQELGQKDKKGQELNQKEKKPVPQSQEQQLKAGDIALQIANETDFALSVRASLVDASERVNLTKAKSANVAAHSREMVALSPIEDLWLVTPKVPERLFWAKISSHRPRNSRKNQNHRQRLKMLINSNRNPLLLLMLRQSM